MSLGKKKAKKRTEGKMQTSLKNNLFQQLQGKNTIEAVMILVHEFINRFGTRTLTASDLMSQLLPRGKACSWAMLDRNINLFCKQFYDTWEEDQDKLAFFDEVRFLIDSMPKKQDYKLPDNKLEYPSPQEAASRFVMCSLCWRVVPRRPLEKKTPLCHVHDIESTSPGYRRRARMKGQVEQIRMGLLKSLPVLTTLKFEQGVNLDNYVFGLCVNEDSPLPYLVRYLNSLAVSHGMPLGSGRKILEDLEAPIYISKLTPLMRDAFDFYLQDKGKHFRLNYVKLMTAEAWLEADDKRRHGGRRR